MAYRDPKTKEDLLDRMTRIDFSGDLRDLGADHNVQLKRLKRHVLRLVFPTTGQSFDLTVHKPRSEAAPKRAPAPKNVTPIHRRKRNRAAPSPAPQAQAPANEESGGEKSQGVA